MESRYKKYEPIFGSWYIKKKIGQGATGVVLLIERNDLGTVYRSALKCITVPQNEDEIKTIKSNGLTDMDVKNYYSSFMDRIKSELTNMARLKGNSNVVNYEDHIIIPHEDGIGWDILIRMELLQPLLEYHEEKPLDESDVIKLGIDMCKALELCGNNGIIHRDVKPENMFMSPNGDFKLGDFGISRTLEETRVGLSRKGTFTYMAPEVFKGEPYGQRSDIYSLGLVLYKFLNGGRNAFLPGPDEPLIYQDNDRAFFRRMSGAMLPPPRDGSERLKSIVLKACSYIAKERYNSAAEMCDDLKELAYEMDKGTIDGVGSTKDGGFDAKDSSDRKNASDDRQTEVAGASTSVKPKRRSKRLILIIAAALLVAAGIVAYAMVPKEITGITGINETERVYLGDSKSFGYAIEPDWFKDEKISFESDNEKVMKVDEAGRITGVRIGSAVLKLQAKDYKKEVHVSVVPKVKDIRGIKLKLSLEEGDSYRLKAKLLPEKFAKEPVTYSSSDKTVAKVSKKGKITARKVGKAIVSVSAGGRTEKIKVTVKEKVIVTNDSYSDADSGANNSDTNSYSGSSSSDSSSSNRSSSGKSSSGSGSRSKSNSGSKSNSNSKRNTTPYFDSDDDEYFDSER